MSDHDPIELLREHSFTDDIAAACVSLMRYGTSQEEATYVALQSLLESRRYLRERLTRMDEAKIRVPTDRFNDALCISSLQLQAVERDRNRNRDRRQALEAALLEIEALHGYDGVPQNLARAALAAPWHK